MRVGLRPDQTRRDACRLVCCFCCQRFTVPASCKMMDHKPRINLLTVVLWIMKAKKVGAYGVPMVIVNGRNQGSLQSLFEGKDTGTLFLPKAERNRSRQHWIAYTACSAGGVVVDDGGREALMNKGKSLLPGGVVRVEGSFKAGDCVNCSDNRGNVFARGLTKYSSIDLEQIKGLKTSQIASVLGHKDYDEVIHRDDLVIL